MLLFLYIDKHDRSHNGTSMTMQDMLIKGVNDPGSSDPGSFTSKFAQSRTLVTQRLPEFNAHHPEFPYQ